MYKKYACAALLCFSICKAGAQAVTSYSSNPGNATATVAGRGDTIYTAHSSPFQINKISASGVETAFAGSGSLGNADGTGTAAMMRYVYDLESDTAGNLYFTDEVAGSLRRVTPAGVVSTLATGMSGVRSVALGLMDTFYTYAPSSGIVYRVAPGGTVSTYASGIFGALDLDFVSPGNFYLAGYLNHVIYRLSGGAFSILAGNGSAGNSDGTGAAASFNNPSSLVVDGLHNIYVTDFSGHLLRKVTPAGAVTTFAGSGTAATTDGTGTAASFNSPQGITVRRTTGSLFVSESGSGATRQVTDVTALPLDWISYSASLGEPRHAYIRWVVKEKDVHDYQVQKSTDGRTFSPIGTLPGKGNGENSYSFTEPQPLQGKAYYRILQTDHYGTYSYSPVLSLTGDDLRQVDIKVYPTLIQESFTVWTEQVLQALLLDARGQTLQVLQLAPGHNTIDASGLSSGHYFLQAGSHVYRIIK
ncbi:MAG TPA: hypothetical protein VL092_05410 [Chitinophagaceae bacterium]|nr:hypothetical protein [Chitinophagaceae bacterium]